MPRGHTHTHAHTTEWLSFYLSLLHTPQLLHLHLSQSPSHIHMNSLSFFSSYTLLCSWNHSHTTIYALNVWLCGVLLQVNNERRGVWPCQKCEKLTQRNQTGAETPPTLRAWSVCVCVKERGRKCVCVHPHLPMDDMCGVIYILLPFYWIWGTTHT